MKDINNKFLSLALKWLYFYDGELFQLSKNSDGHLVRVNAKTTASVPVLVVTRNYYQEKLQEYPVDNTKELKKVLALELGSEEHSTRFIWGQRQSKSIVSQYQFSEQLPEAKLVLPETLLLGLSVSKNSLLSIDDEKTLFLYRDSVGIHSSFSQGIVSTLEHFALSVGCSTDTPKLNYTTEQKFAVLANEAPKQLMSLQASYVRPKGKKRDYRFLLPKVLLPVSLVMLSYFTLTTGYLYFDNQRLKSSYAEQASSVGTILDRQASLDEKIAEVDAWQKLLTNKQPITPFWQVVEPLLVEADFTSYRLSKGRYSLRGTAKKATTVLEKLAAIEGVENASFDAPTRKSGANDVFVIGFEFTPSQLSKQQVGEG